MAKWIVQNNIFKLIEAINFEDFEILSFEILVASNLNLLIMRLLLLLHFIVIQFTSLKANNLLLLKENNQQNDSIGLPIHHFYQTKSIIKQVNILMKKHYKDDFTENKELLIYDISYKKDMSKIAVLGCFLYRNACKTGKNLIILERNKKFKKNKCIWIGNEYQDIDSLTFSNALHFPILYAKTGFLYPGRPEIHKMEIQNGNIVVKKIRYADNGIPYEIIKFVLNDNQLSGGFKLNDIIENLRIKKIEVSDNTKIFYIDHWLGELQFSCEQDDTNCKLIEQK